VSVSTTSQTTDTYKNATASAGFNRTDRLSAREAAKDYGINQSTLGSWRYRRAYDKRFPRYHKIFTGAVYYLRHELEEDLANMEIDVDSTPANL